MKECLGNWLHTVHNLYSYKCGCRCHSICNLLQALSALYNNQSLCKVLAFYCWSSFFQNRVARHNFFHLCLSIIPYRRIVPSKRPPLCKHPPPNFDNSNVWEASLCKCPPNNIVRYYVMQCVVSADSCSNCCVCICFGVLCVKSVVVMVELFWAFWVAVDHQLQRLAHKALQDHLDLRENSGVCWLLTVDGALLPQKEPANFGDLCWNMSYKAWPSSRQLRSNHADCRVPEQWRALLRFLDSTAICRHESLGWHYGW